MWFGRGNGLFIPCGSSSVPARLDANDGHCGRLSSVLLNYSRQEKPFERWTLRFLMICIIVYNTFISRLEPLLSPLYCTYSVQAIPIVHLRTCWLLKAGQ
ncbi:hypothetical protein J3458_000954 [Metarhizium acridum]|uniref:uncharacterized protein n=1 Tax=Metarhizium acridum TaxID=92637 RepID=UPI001C6BCAC6|nr:hypothetical protein J3458_000954 [Metarhizium acridum]